MILNPSFYHQHGLHDPLEDSPPRLLAHSHPSSFPHQAPVGYPYASSQHSAFHQQQLPASYPSQRPPLHHPAQISPFMPQLRPPPRPVPPSLLNDPAFSPDPRSNQYFFSMNDREEIYPASPSDSLSDYASTAPDDESEVDHSNLPPRLRMLHGADNGPQPPALHSRSQSVPYPPLAPTDQYILRSTSARVIPVPPPISRASASTYSQSFREDPRQTASGPYASASTAARQRELWQPPPPYTDSESGSSSSSSPQTPASSSSHLPREAQRSTSSLPPASAYASEKPSAPRTPPSAASQTPSNAQVPPSATSRGSPPAESKTSTVQSTAVRPPINPRNASAPELQPPPPPTDVPPRPSTVPIPAPSSHPVSAPVAQRKRSKNPSIATAPRDLDRIDELDESDPLGFAWHHDGPYEAIAKAAPVLYPEQSLAGQKRTEPPKRKPVQYDSVDVGVAPGQIFPSNSQYQPPTAAQLQQRADARGPENLPPGSPSPSSPLMQVPVRRRVPPSGELPSTPLQYSNLHMGPTQAQQQGSRPQHQPPPPVQTQRSRHEEAPQPSPPLPNPYSPAESQFPSGVQDQRNSPPRQHTTSTSPSRSEPPSSNAMPRPDITLPPQQSNKSSSSFLPRHLPKKLVMPAPLQPLQQPNGQAPDNRGTAHVEVLTQRHNPQTPATVAPSVRSGAPSMQTQSSQHQHQHQHQHARAQDIPISHGPKVLKKRHTTGSAPLPVPLPAAGEIPASNTTAALFAARVRFAEPPREETKEERKRREKEEARRAKEREKAERARAKEQAHSRSNSHGVLGGIFVRDQVKEAELAREREAAKAQASAKSSAGRKLSKRR
ncbi:hypothetical protein C8Q77DRAFT_1152609 [Trametes polyzona]|nr:hypothetical protein C8Q77DRAFT_1152609 [Trametes polyzona]